MLLPVGFYLLGSVPFALLWSRAFGLPDPRTYGSGNPGTSNVARSGNRLAAILTLLCDAGKGGLVAVPKALGAGSADLWGGLALAVVAGHVFPVFTRFRGGKGVATALGAIAALDWVAGLAAAATWGAVFLVTRMSAPASLLGLLAAGAACLPAGSTDLRWWAYALILLLVTFRHRENIARMLARSESRF